MKEKSYQVFSSSVVRGILVVMLVILPTNTCHGNRFQTLGPVITVTLKDTDSSSLQQQQQNDNNKWMDWNTLRPKLHWSFSSHKPLPKWFPSLESLQGTIGYHYDQMIRMGGISSSTSSISNNDDDIVPKLRRYLTEPTLMEGMATFRTPQGIQIDIVPTIQQQSSSSSSSSSVSRKSSLLIQLAKGSGSILAEIQKTSISFLKGCYQFDLDLPQINKIRLTPSYNCIQREPAILLEATTGSQRTKTVLNLQSQNPTLTVVHALDDRHTIAPEISLYNARIIYQWNIRLDNGNIQTQVDPTDSIKVTWTDSSPTDVLRLGAGGGNGGIGGGKWVTRLRIPLSGTSRSALQTDIQVQRQFTF